MNDPVDLLELARGEGTLPATAEDAEAALAALNGAAFDYQRTVAALQDAICARLAPLARRDPDAAFADAAESFEMLTGRPPGIPAIQEIATLIARAAGLDPAAAKALRQRLVAAEQSRRQAERQARERARELQRDEERRLREWESELVGADALPAMLGAPRKLVDRWIAEGLIPVARSTTVRHRGRRVEELEFH
ncbi:MAG TPA: hypothetical protein VE650_07200, partial [Acetobacteraceae bacterium]|nr:hypothetical protein [Acetobacteraceae bacterium]